MNFLLKVREVFQPVYVLYRKICGNLGLDYLYLMIAVLYQLVLDAIWWREDRPDFSDQSSQIISGTVFGLWFLYRVWRRSDYYRRTMAAWLLIAYFAIGIAIVFAKVSIARGAMIPLDALFLLGLLALRYGGSVKKPFPTFEVKEI